MSSPNKCTEHVLITSTYSDRRLPVYIYDAFVTNRLLKVMKRENVKRRTTSQNSTCPDAGPVIVRYGFMYWQSWVLIVLPMAARPAGQQGGNTAALGVTCDVVPHKLSNITG